MYHELIFALHGYPGSIFVDNGHGSIKVIKELPFLHPSEEVILDKLCTLGTVFRELKTFIEQHGRYLHVDIGETEKSHCGLYVQALCDGLNEVLEQQYCQDLVDLEEDILKDPYISLTCFQEKLAKYFSLFPVLQTITEEIIRQKTHGCQILDVLHKYSQSGFFIVQSSVQLILQKCHRVLNRQMSAWLLHGILSDPYEEFFVCPDIRNEIPENRFTDDSVSEDLQKNGCHARAGQKHTLDNFRIVPDLLPSCLPMHLAEKILFVGCCVNIFGKESENQPMIKATSMFGEKEKDFARSLLLLEGNEFVLGELQLVIDEIRNCAAEHLWHLIVEDANLVRHLQIIKDIYLLGRGELFQAFIDHANSDLRMTPSKTLELDVNAAFQQSARKVLLDDECMIETFTVTVRQTPGQEATSQDGWSCVGLVCDVPWPLHVLFTPSVLERYSHMFRFLLAVRHVQMELGHCWAIQMQNKGLGRDSQCLPIWQLRTHMAFLIDNLQYYLQVDVLESHFSMLLDKVKTVKDFEAIRHAHDHFLTSILAQSFLFLEPVHNCLNEILSLCLQFCGLISQATNLSDCVAGDHLKNISLNFSCQTLLLFQVLLSVHSHQTNPHFSQFLLRVDYNKYFPTARGHF